MTYPDIPFYNIGGYLRIDGPVDPVVFEMAIRRVVQTNDALRIVLHTDNSVPVQEFRDDDVFDLPYIDFSDQDNPMQKAEAWMRDQFVKPFDLYGKFLFRYALLKVSDRCYCYFNNQHHLVADGLSILILAEQLAAEYNALIKGVPCQVTPPSYRDVLADDQKFLKSNRFEQFQKFWQETFRDLPESLIQARFNNHQSDLFLRGGLSSLRITPNSYAVLDDFCKTQGVTPYHLLLAALYTCFLYNGIQKDFVFGAPVLNRPNARAKKTIGLFTSVSPVRFNFGFDVTVCDLLKLINGELKRIYRYQRLPLSEINKCCGVAREFGRQLFDIGVSYEKNDYGVNFDGARAQAVTYSNGFERNALSIALKEYRKGDDIELDFSYNMQVFDDREIEYLKNRILFIMEEMVRNPQMCLRRLDVLPKREKQDVLAVWNETQKDTPQKLAHNLFEDLAVQTPNQIAAVCGNQKITYKALDEKASQLSQYLMAQGVGPKMLVGICIDRSINMLVAILGVLKSGAAYLPLDPHYPKARIAFMVDDAQVKMILSEEVLASVLADSDRDVLFLDSDQDIWKAQGVNAELLACCDVDDVAYVIYTSGSTGEPKGAMIAHRSLVNLICAQIRLFDIEPKSRVLQFASFGFDASVSEIFTALSSGATLVLASKEHMMPGPDLIKTIKDFDVTHVTLPPSSLGVLPDVALPSLKTLVVAGEACPEDLAIKWGQGRRFMNAYGPTEATVCASTWVFNGEAGKPPIGRAIDNVQLYVLNDDLRPVPVGCQGELHIAGLSLAMGYLNRPALNCEKFIPNPFANKGSRLYKTGDLARWRADGQLEFLGRKDTQVKIRGFRIELEEVASVLRQHHTVLDAVVLVTDVGTSGKQLVAYFIEDQGECADPLVLKSFLAETLPDYMTPRFLIAVDTFPLTPSGKIDHNGFPKPGVVFDKDTENDLPVTDHEKIILTVWNEVIPDVPIGVHDNFFDVGLDSLQAIQFISHLKEKFDIALHPSTIFQKNTVKALGKFVSEQKLNDSSFSQSIVEVQVKASYAPFFCVTGGYGDVLVFRELAQFLPRSFYALQPPKRGEIDGGLSLSNLAQHYVTEMKRVQPKGPFFLGGYSLGGLLALEMAHQLQEVEDEVGAVVIFGAPLIHGSLGHWVYGHLMRFAKKWVPQPGHSQSEVMRIMGGLFRDEGLQMHMACLAGYVAQPYPGKITIFEGQKASSRFYPWKKKWQQLATGGLEVVMLPGNHDSFIRPPHHKELARRLEACLCNVADDDDCLVGLR